MTDPSFIPESERELLVVYPDAARADAARSALVRAGVPDDSIRIGEEPDVVASLRAEMREELTQAWVVPNAAAIYPKEAARGVVAFSIIGVMIGLVAAFPLALIDFGATYWTRWIVFAAVGMAFGFTIGLVAGAGAGARRPAEPLAATRGVLLRVDRDTPDLRVLLADLEPIRMDEVSHGGDPIATVTTEAGDPVTETVSDVGANVGGDDYHPER